LHRDRLVDFTNQVQYGMALAVSTPLNILLTYALSAPFYTMNGGVGAGGSGWTHVSLAAATPTSGLAATTTASATSASGSATLTVGSCSKAVAGETAWDIQGGGAVNIGQIVSCASTTLTLNANSLATVTSGDNLLFNGVADPVSVTAGASWALHDTTLTISGGSCAGIYPTAEIFDYTYSPPKTIGVVSSCAAGTVTLLAAATSASSGSADSLFVSLYANSNNDLIQPYRPYYTTAADRVTAGTFYIALATTNSATSPSSSRSGIYKLTGGGGTVTFMGNHAFGFNIIRLKATPSNANDIWIAGGLVGGGTVVHPGASSLFHSTDGGATFATISSSLIKEPMCVGFGAPASGQSYPSVYVVSWGGGITDLTGYGMWRSTDQGVTWTMVGPAVPRNSVDPIMDCEGNMAIYGYGYIAFEDNGFAWGYFPYLLNRDLDPASNDNTPAYLDKAA
jgi:hypothetical protein